MGILSSDEINEIAYNAGFKAGLRAAQAPVKWPSEQDIHSKMKELAPEGYDSRTFYETVEWLKNYREKGE